METSGLFVSFFGYRINARPRHRTLWRRLHTLIGLFGYFIHFRNWEISRMKISPTFSDGKIWFRHTWQLMPILWMPILWQRMYCWYFRVPLCYLRTLSIENVLSILRLHCRFILLASNDSHRDISRIIVQLEAIKMQVFRDSCNYADTIFDFDYYADIYLRGNTWKMLM